jgi:hypothetical protein
MEASGWIVSIQKGWTEALGFCVRISGNLRLSGLIFTFITDTDPVDHVPETGSYENYTHQRHQRYNGTYHDLYRKKPDSGCTKEEEDHG